MSRLHDIAEECARYLDGSWRILRGEAWTEYQQRAVLQDDAKRGRWLILSDYYRGPGRMQIYGSSPGRKSIGHRITVSMSRPVPDIAADITRRFLPGYLEAWTQAEAEHEAHLAQLEDLRVRRQLIKSIDRSMRPAVFNSGDEATDFYIDSGSFRLSTYNRDVRLEANMSFEKFIRVLHILRE